LEKIQQVKMAVPVRFGLRNWPCAKADTGE